MPILLSIYNPVISFAVSKNPYRERLRILLILYFFSEDVSVPGDPRLQRVFHSEVKIQKIDFLIRYPNYLCYELLRMHEESGEPSTEKVQAILTNIFRQREPELKTDEMRRFFYGAYEELDNVISFLTSVDLVIFKSKRNVGLKTINKEYYLTRFALETIENGLKAVPAAAWYFERCSLIKTYFGDLSGSQFKNRQYAIDIYRETPLGNYIADIEKQVREKYQQLFDQSL